MISDDLLNPDGNLPAQDRTLPVQAVPGWTEHYAYFAHDPATEHGTFIHIGRVIDDPSLWRGVIQIFLPGDALLVGKYFGRDQGDGAATAGLLRLFAEQPFRRFTVDFDGMLQRTTRQAITSAVALDDVSERVRMHVLFEAAAPIQGRQGTDQTDRAVSSFHTDQIGRISGEIETRGGTVALSGVGVRDHSSGVRHYGKVIGHLWIHGLMPSGLAFSITILRTTSNPTLKVATVFWGDGTPREFVDVTDFPEFPEEGSMSGAMFRDPVEDPVHRACSVTLATSRGPLEIAIRPVHTHAITYLDPCEELVGTAMQRPDGIQMCDAPAMFTCKGETGSGLFERSGRIGILG